MAGELKRKPFVKWTPNEAKMLGVGIFLIGLLVVFETDQFITGLGLCAVGAILAFAMQFFYPNKPDKPANSQSSG